MDLVSGFPASARTRIIANLGLDSQLAGKHGLNAPIAQDARSGEVHPWVVTISATQTAYLYAATYGVGVFDTKLGIIWSYNPDTGDVQIRGSQPWTAANFNPNTKTNKSVQWISGDGVNTIFFITHNLNTQDFTFSVTDVNGGNTICDVYPNNANQAIVRLGAPLAQSETRKVVIIG